MTDIVQRLRDSATQARALDRSDLLNEAANEIDKLRQRLRLADAALRSDSPTLTDAERASMTRAIETLEGVDYMEAFRTENDATAAATLRGLMERLQ